MINVEWYNAINPEVKSFSQTLPKDLYSIFIALREVLLINLPFVNEELIDDIPTYKLGNKKVLYILCYSDRVVLGFYQGSKLSNSYNLFSPYSYRNIREIDFYSIHDTLNMKVVSYLQEAMMCQKINENSYQRVYSNFA